jgi:hypothetical protein
MDRVPRAKKITTVSKKQPSQRYAATTVGRALRLLHVPNADAIWDITEVTATACFVKPIVIVPRMQPRHRIAAITAFPPAEVY